MCSSNPVAQPRRIRNFGSQCMVIQRPSVQIESEWCENYVGKWSCQKMTWQVRRPEARWSRLSSSQCEHIESNGFPMTKGPLTLIKWGPVMLVMSKASIIDECMVRWIKRSGRTNAGQNFDIHAPDEFSCHQSQSVHEIIMLRGNHLELLTPLS